MFYIYNKWFILSTDRIIFLKLPEISTKTGAKKPEYRP